MNNSAESLKKDGVELLRIAIYTYRDESTAADEHESQIISQYADDLTNNYTEYLKHEKFAELSAEYDCDENEMKKYRFSPLNVVIKREMSKRYGILTVHLHIGYRRKGKTNLEYERFFNFKNGLLLSFGDLYKKTRSVKTGETNFSIFNDTVYIYNNALSENALNKKVKVIAKNNAYFDLSGIEK